MIKKEPLTIFENIQHKVTRGSSIGSFLKVSTHLEAYKTHHNMSISLIN